MSSDKVVVTKAKLNRISDAIQEKGGASGSLTLDEMPNAIRAISGGGGGGGGHIHLLNPVIRVGNVTGGSTAITVTEVIPAE